MEPPKDSPNVPIEESVSSAIIDQLQRLYSSNPSITDLREYMLDHPTAFPIAPDNKEYAQIDGANEKEFLKQHLHGRVLDIGSGGVNELEDVIDENDTFYIDANPQEQVNFQQVNIGPEHMPFDDGNFDGVFSRNVINSRETAEQVLPEIFRVLKPDGTSVLGFRFANFEEMKKSIVGTLHTINSRGIDIRSQCDLTLFESYLEHKNLPIKLNLPAVYINTRLKETLKK